MLVVAGLMVMADGWKISVPLSKFLLSAILVGWSGAVESVVGRVMFIVSVAHRRETLCG
jgi:uncharacterized membrane protein